MNPAEYLANYAEILAAENVWITFDPAAEFADDEPSEAVVVIYATLLNGQSHYRAWAIADGARVGEGRI
jgi:hypothetical protein